MNKIRIGIFFGGSSREREISFAGGRTVYDNLNKTIFEPVPIFIDSFHNLILLDWQYIYKGSIRDFYPPVNFIPTTAHPFQVYIESLQGTQGSPKSNPAWTGSPKRSSAVTVETQGSPQGQSNPAGTESTSGVTRSEPRVSWTDEIISTD